MYNRSNLFGKNVLLPKNPNQTSNERPSKLCKLDPKARLKHWPFAQLILTLALTLFLLPSLSLAAQVTLQWDGVSPAPDGYRLYRRTASSSYNYSSPAWSGSATNCTLQLAYDTTYYYIARSYKGSLQSVNSNEVKVYVQSNSVDPVPDPTPTPTPVTQVTINNSTSRTSSTGKWQISQASGNYSSQSLYSEEVGAEYSFKTYLTGLYELNLWWTANNTRCSDVPVEVYNNNELLDVLTINQQQNGGKWNTVGTYNFSGSAQVTFVSGHSECVTSVDSVHSSRFKAKHKIKSSIIPAVSAIQTVPGWLHPAPILMARIRSMAKRPAAVLLLILRIRGLSEFPCGGQALPRAAVASQSISSTD